MSDDQKPVEPVIPTLQSPRDRVIEHLRTALSVGVASVMVTGTTSCIVADPPPRPSACRSSSPKSNMSAMVTAAGPRLRVDLTSTNAEFTPTSSVLVTGGALDRDLISGSTWSALILPTGGTIEVRFRFSCMSDFQTDSAVVGVRLTPKATDGGTDGGLSDGGVSSDYTIELFDE